MDEITDLTTLKEFLTASNNLVNTVYISKVPQICKDEPCVLGIDEAGRGPVLGPMVYGIAFCPLVKADILNALKCADSKVLTEEKRNEIFSKICKSLEIMGWATELISPNTICNSMYSRSKVSLNDISINSAIGLIRKAEEHGVNIAQIYVDTVGPPEKYEKYLSSLFPKYSIIVAKKADSTYPIVSAASICAKVTRDHSLQVWKFENGLNAEETKFGSGYPGDPATKKFLQTAIDPIFGFPHFVRFSWSTTENILQKEAYQVEWEEVPDKTKPICNNPQLTSFFAFKKSGSRKEKYRFFTERGIESANIF